MSEIIKEYCEGNNGGVIVLREDAYGSSLAKFEKLFAEFQRDFPNLNVDKERDVNIVKYGGQHYAKTFGLEISVPKIKVPDSYRAIGQLEYT